MVVRGGEMGSMVAVSSPLESCGEQEDIPASWRTRMLFALKFSGLTSCRVAWALAGLADLLEASASQG